MFQTFQGSNLQLIIYFLAVLESLNKTKTKPIAIFNCSISGNLNKFSLKLRNPTSEQIKENLLKGFAMNGLVLEDYAEKFNFNSNFYKFNEISSNQIKELKNHLSNLVNFMLQSIKILNFKQQPILLSANQLQCSCCEFSAICNSNYVKPTASIKISDVNELITLITEQNENHKKF